MACSFSFQTLSLLQLVKDQLSIQNYLRQLLRTVDKPPLPKFNRSLQFLIVIHTYLSQTGKLWAKRSPQQHSVDSSGLMELVRLIPTFATSTATGIRNTMMGNICGDPPREDLAPWLTPTSAATRVRPSLQHSAILSLCPVVILKAAPSLTPFTCSKLVWLTGLETPAVVCFLPDCSGMK